MSKFSPTQMIIAGIILLIIGVVLPFLMVIQILENDFILSFISYAASISGLVIGTIGAMTLSIARRKKDEY